MKRKNKLTIIATLGLSTLLGLTAITLTNSNNAVVTKAEGEADKYIFVQVTDYADLRLDDTVIFASGNIAIDRLGGNPCFTGGLPLSNGTGYNTKFNFESTSAAMFTVENGYDGYGYYSFKCTRTEAQDEGYWLKTAGRYLSYGQGYHEDDIDISTKGDVIFKEAKDEYSSFNVDFDENGFVYLSRANEPNRYGQEGVTDPISIKWSNQYVKNGIFGYYFGMSNLHMYRKVNVKESNLDIQISEDPYKTAYNAGEYSDLRGLELTIQTKDTYMTFKSIYDLDEALFDALPVVYDGDKSYAPFRWLGIELDFTATVYPDRAEENNYYHVNKPEADLRGTYILAAPGNGYTSILDTTRLNGEDEDHFYSGYVVQLEGQDINPICDSTYNGEGERIIVEDVANNVVSIVKESDGYFIKIGNDYLAFEERPSSYCYVYRGNKEHSKPVTVNANNELVIDYNGNKTLVFDKSVSKVYLQSIDPYSSNQYQVELYRYTMKGEQYSEMNTYKGTFLTKTASCDITGEVNNLNLSDWEYLANAFNNLSVDSQSYLASIVYSHNQEEENSLKDMADRYDHIVSKYSGEGFIDFMSRGDAGTLQQNSAYAFVLLNNIENNTLIVIVISIISVVSLTTLLILKKKQK